MNKAFDYARKSSEDKEKQIQSIEDQLDEVDKLHERYLDIPVIDTYSESKTGKVSGVRDAFYKMIERIEKGEANTIFCWKADRLARNGSDGGKIIEMVDNGIIKQIITPNTVYDRANSYMLWIEFMGSTKYSKDLSDNVVRALNRKAERGDFPNQAPIGYKNTPQRLKGTRIILVDKKRWNLCRKWWDLMLTDTYTVESSLDKINTMGLTGKNGKPVSRTTAFRFFHNIFYTGNFEIKGLVHPGNHKPMITMAEFVKVQRIIEEKGKKGAHTLDFKEEKTFQGMLRCGECNACITMEKQSKKRKDGIINTNWYYRCTKKLGQCSQPYLKAEEFEPQVKSYIESLELNPKFGDWIKKVIKRRNAKEFSFERKQQEMQTKRLATITDSKERLYGMKNDGLFSEQEYQKRKRELLIEEQQVRESLQTSTTQHWESVIDNILNFATSVSRLFDNGDIFTRQMILKILGSNLILKDKKVYIEAKSAFIFLKDKENSFKAENLWLEPRKSQELGQSKGILYSSPMMCRGRDSNPHEVLPHALLRRTCLPFHHLGLFLKYLIYYIIFSQKRLGSTLFASFNKTHEDWMRR